MNNDLISRSALKKAIMYKTGVAEETWEQLYDSVLEEIDNAPTVDTEKVLIANVSFDEDKLKDLVQTEVIDKIKNGELVIKDERPQGEWIAIEPYNHKTFCPFCKKDTRDMNYDNFCPNCGAKMKGGAE